MSSSTALGQVESAPSALDPFQPVSGLQPHGLLLVLRAPALRILQISANAGPLLQRPLDSLLLATLHELGGDIASRLRQMLAAGLPNEPQPLHCTVGDGARALPFVGTAHRVDDEAVVLELEPLPQPAHCVDQPADVLLERLGRAVQTFSVCPDLPSLADAATQVVRELLGYDHVHMLGFGSAGGPALADVAPGALVLQQRVRVLADVRRPQVELVPHLTALHARPFDLARSHLRGTTAAHARQLQDRGVVAAVLICIVREGAPWGLISCEHAQPRLLSDRLRAACELLAEVLATRVAAIDSQVRALIAAQVQSWEEHFVEAAAADGDGWQALCAQPRRLLEPMAATGAVLQHAGGLRTCGEVPPPEQLQALLHWLARQPGAGPLHSASLRRDHRELAGLSDAAAGVLAVRLPGSPVRQLVWLRRAPAGHDAEPWNDTVRALAAACAHALADHDAQANAVRLLIAQNQLAQMRDTVARAPEAVVVADAAQQAFYANAAFFALAGRRRDECTSLDMLSALFTDPHMAHGMIGQVRAEQRAWRGELAFARPGADALPVAVRAEPVPSLDGTLLGTLFFFEDLSGGRRTDAARQRLDATLSRAGRAAWQAPGDPGLVGAIITNAGLAAMDVAELGGTPALAPLLEELEASTARATALLGRIRRDAGA